MHLPFHYTREIASNNAGLFQFINKEIKMAFELPELPYAYDALAAGGMSRGNVRISS